MKPDTAVLLVDNKLRDLMGATLIAYHLEQLGIHCQLETVGAYQGVLAAHRPRLIVFNQLTSGHLVRYSQRLAALGVATAVLTNEGISYDPNLLKFIVGSHHSNAHIDLYFCWNAEKKRALEEIGLAQKTQIAIVGVPRFDFYFPPWCRIYQNNQPHPKPRILVCTNFAHADFRDLPPEEGEKFFASVKGRVPGYDNHIEAMEVHYQNRLRFFPFLDEIVRSNLFTVILRPHPFESKQLYRDWYNRLPPHLQQNTTLDPTSPITQLILNSDLQISCETCTTAIESWIARVPTIELVFQKHPIYFHPEHAALTPLCDNPKDIVGLIQTELDHPSQPHYLPGRQTHLQKWCHSPNGTACLQVAQTITRALQHLPKPNWPALTWNDHRRGLKLKLMRQIGQNYQFDPLLQLKARLFKSKYSIKAFTHRNFIKPTDVAQARAAIQKCAQSAPPAPHT